MSRDHRLDFGTYVAIRREELGLSATAVSSAAGVTQDVYSSWEHCERLPQDDEQVRRLATRLELAEIRLLDIWRRTEADTKKKGFVILARAFDVDR